MHFRKVQRLPEDFSVLNHRLERPAPERSDFRILGIEGDEIVHSGWKQRDTVNPLVPGSSPGGPTKFFLMRVTERTEGIEPSALAWEARVLPLYDARVTRHALLLDRCSFPIELHLRRSEYCTHWRQIAPVLGAEHSTYRQRAGGVSR